MKYLETLAILLLIFLCATASSAQKLIPGKPVAAPNQLQLEKPRIFTNLPEKFVVNKSSLDRLFATQNARISVPVSAELSLEGTIIEKVQQNPNVVSINIRLNNYDSSLLNISRITQSDLSVSYIARVMNIKNGDILLLKKEDGQFYFTREKQSLIAVE